MRYFEQPEFATERQRVHASLVEAFEGTVWLPSVINMGFAAPPDAADEFSHLSYYAYYTGCKRDRDDIGDWLGEHGMIPWLQYCTGLEKHRVLISGVRVDIKMLGTERRSDIASWPALFFDPETDIIKDVDGSIKEALRHRAEDPPPIDINRQNDRDGYMLALFNVAIQLIRGQAISSQSRLVGMINDRARLLRDPELIGSLTWLDPSSGVEKALPKQELEQLMGMCFFGDEEVYRYWLIEKLLSIAENEEFKEDVREMANVYADRLGASALKRD